MANLSKYNISYKLEYISYDASATTKE